MFEALQLLFTDPVFQIPFWGSITICVCYSLVGSLLFVQRKTLLGETLSHAAYPGIIIGGWLGFETFSSSALLIGGILTSLCAYFLVELCIHKRKMSQDTALSFILASFWGLAVLLVSRLQFSKIAVFREVKVFLFGQAATLSSLDFFLALCFLAICFILLVRFFYPLQAFLFDSQFTHFTTIPLSLFKVGLSLLVVSTMVIGMRCVGVVLMMGMLVAPPIFARQFTHKLSKVFLMAAGLGAFSSFLGNLIPLLYPHKNLPTGPLMVFIAAIAAIGALFFAPNRGYLYRLLQLLRFQTKCHIENILKFLWKHPKSNYSELASAIFLTPWRLFYYLQKMKREGWIQKQGNSWDLSKEGKKKAEHIIRLHRLWELYLVNYMKVDVEKVHFYAEHMEHVLTKELEQKLDLILANPATDPHNQPIPQTKGFLE